ncbi:hypothetical protein Droror1_Dr00012335 [Drosera rotundifolia]
MPKTTTAPPPPTPAALAALILKTPTQHLPTLLHPLPLSTTLIDQTLKRLWNHAPAALSFFHHLLLNHNRHHKSISHSTFNLVIDLAARSRDHPTLWKILKMMRTRRLNPNPRTFAIIMERYANDHKPDRAVRIFLNMHKYGCRQGLEDFNCLLDVLCKAKRVEKAEELVRVFGRRFGVDVVSYNVIANGWCEVGKTGKALGVLREMVEDGVSPTVWSYNVMMKGYFRAGQVREAWEFFLEIKRRGVEVDVVTYTTLVHGFGMAGEVARARNVFKRMLEEGVLPTVATYNALIQVLCRKDKVEEGMQLFEEMIKKGYVPNSVTYNLLIRGFCSVGEMETAVEFMGRMEKDGCEPNIHTYNLLIRHYCDQGELEKGVEWFHKMRFGPCLPNRDTYNILINSMFVRKKAEDLVLAGELLIEMVDRGFLPKRFTFNRVLNGLLLMGNQAFAKEILRLQSTSGHLPRQFRL